MITHSFVDESKTSTYMLVAVFIRPANLAPLRRELASLVLPRQRRIHFHAERPDRRSQLIDLFVEMPLEAAIYETPRGMEKAARDGCLAMLIRDHLERDVRRLVLERDDSRVDSDRKLLHDEVTRAGSADRLSYEHLRAYEEPLLAIPDAIAWCWARGGHWRVKAKRVVTCVHQV